MNLGRDPAATAVVAGVARASDENRGDPGLAEAGCKNRFGPQGGRR